MNKLLLGMALAVMYSTSVFAETIFFIPPTIPTSTTVAGLPTCSSSTTGWTYIVTNSLLPVLGSSVGGGGLVSVVVRCNGTLWLVGQ